MEVQKGLLRELWNCIRIAAGLKAVAGIREQSLQRFVFQISVRRGINALHLVIDNAVIAQLAIKAVNIIMPALLTQSIFVFINQRIKNSVQINIHQVMEVLIVAAGNRINRFIRISHSIQKGVQRALHKVDKRLLQMIFARAAERGMLQNMCHACIICRRRSKGNRKHLVVIIIRKIEKTGAALLMLHNISIRLDFFHIALLQHLKAMADSIYF